MSKQPARISTVVAAFLAAPAWAAESPSYRDDRSDPQALVESLYNAVNRREFGRALSYFSVPPAADVATYAASYASTERVTVRTGEPASEDLEGARVFTVPVAIAIRGTDGQERSFSGCYTVRLEAPEPDGAYRPMAIDGGKLAPASGLLEHAVPTACEGAPPLPARNALLDRARAMFVAAHGADCAGAPVVPPQTHDIRVTEEDQDADKIPKLIGFPCDRAADNATHVYYVADRDGGLSELSLTVPELDIRYEGDGNETLDSMNVIGFKTIAKLANPNFDPATLTLTSLSNWREAGDASSAGTWIFRNGAFTLVKFEVDPTQDGKTERTAVIDYDTGP